MQLGLLAQLLDLVLRKSTAGRDRDLLLLARRLVSRRDVEDAVRVEVERHLYLRDSTRRRQDAVEDETSQRLVVGRHRPLTLQHMDLDARLVVRRRREHLRLARRDRRVARDQRRRHAAERLDAKGQRRHVEQQHVAHFALQHSGLDRRADRHDLIRIHALVRLLAEERPHLLLHQRHARLAADEHHLIDLRRIYARVLQRLLHRSQRLLDQIADELFQLRPRDADRHVLGTRRVRSNKRQVDVRLLGARQLDLRLLRRFLQPL